MIALEVNKILEKFNPPTQEAIEQERQEQWNSLMRVRQLLTRTAAGLNVQVFQVESTA